MGYEDHTVAELIALTRERRQEARARRLASIPPPIRYSGPSDEFQPPSGHIFLSHVPGRILFKLREWKRGHRNCSYCGVRMHWRGNRPRSLTLDHRVPLAENGPDDESNWCLACNDCNQRKGTMSEEDFRALLAGDPNVRYP